MSIKKQKTNLVAAKELAVGDKIRLFNGTTAYVFKQHNFYDENENDVFKTDCVYASSNIDEQRLFTIDGELKVEVIDTEIEIVFVRDLEDDDCILVQCDAPVLCKVYYTPQGYIYPEAKHQFVQCDVPVLCKVYYTSQGYIYPEAKHQFNLQPKATRLFDANALIEEKSFVEKMSHGFSCLMFEWNYFQKGRFFFHERELELHSLRDDADEFEDSQVLSTLIADVEWGICPEMAENLVKKYAKDIDMFYSMGEIKKCRKYAQALYQFIDRLYCFEEVSGFFPSAVQDSEISKDILQFVEENYGD